MRNKTEATKILLEAGWTYEDIASLFTPPGVPSYYPTPVRDDRPYYIPPAPPKPFNPYDIYYTYC